MGELNPDGNIVPSGEVDPLTGIDPRNILTPEQEVELRRHLYELAMNRRRPIPHIPLATILDRP